MDRHVHICRARDSITGISGRSARTFRGPSELDLSSSPANPLERGWELGARGAGWVARGSELGPGRTRVGAALGGGRMGGGGGLDVARASEDQSWGPARGWERGAGWGPTQSAGPQHNVAPGPT